MRKLLFVIFLCSFLFTNGQSKDNINGNLIGYIDKSDFLNGKHSDWFSKNYDTYTPDKKITQKIKMKKVLLTGVSGYIGLHCAVELLKKGYSVRGSLRNLDKSANVVNAIKKEIDLKWSATTL